MQLGPSSQTFNWTTNSPHFMKHESSLPHSHEFATCSYHEPDKSSPCSTSHFLKTHFNIIVPSTPMSSMCYVFLSLPTKTLYTPLLSPLRATRPAHLILLNFITRTILGEDYRSLSSSLCSFLYSPVTSSLLGPNILTNVFSNSLSLRSSLNTSDQVSHPYKTTGKTIVL